MTTRGRCKRFRMIIPKYPTFNIYSTAAKKITALGPLCVATGVSKMDGWEVEVIDENNYRYPGPVNEEGCPNHVLLQELRPADVVGFYGGLSCTIPRLYDLARFYGGMGVLTIAGGQHPDFEPGEALENGVDVVVHGEGEFTIKELCKAWERGDSFEGVSGVSFMDAEGGTRRTADRPLITDFETLPLPDFGLLRFARVSIYPVSRVRGCGKNCEFCSVKGSARCGSPERLVKQFAYLAETFRARRFFVVDDHFAQDRDESIRFCRLLARYQRRMGLSFFIFVQVRLETARDDELIQAMKECGVRVLAIGYESVLDEELRSMKKGQSSRDMLEWTRKFQRAGFIIHGMFIFGYPQRKENRCDLDLDQRVRRYKRFLRKSRLDTVQVLHPVPLPGTELRARMQKEGRLLSGDEISWEYYDGNFPLLQPDPPFKPEEIQDAALRIMRGFYRFNALFMVVLRVLLFPVMMLPPINLRARFRGWYRSWRRNVLGFAGWNLINKWKKKLRADAFRCKLRRVVSRRRSETAGT